MTEVLTQILLVIAGSTELSIVAKATTIVMLGLVALRMLRLVPASVRSLLLASTFGILFVLPTAAVVMRPVPLEVGSAPMTRDAPDVSGAIVTVRSDDPVVTRMERSANFVTNRTLVSARLLLVTAWATGALLFLVPVIQTLWRLRGMRRSSLRRRNGETLVRDLAREGGVNRVVEFFVYDDLVAPFTYGLTRPCLRPSSMCT